MSIERDLLCRAYTTLADRQTASFSQPGSLLAAMNLMDDIQKYLEATKDVPKTDFGKMKPSAYAMQAKAMEHLDGKSAKTMALRGAFLHGWLEAELHHFGGLG
jgi:hypothetical protein